MVTKAVILAGGLGTRLMEETGSRPKPMVEIGERPIIWHIMKTYYAHGIREFVICLGYKGYVIKEYFSNYFRHTADFTISLDNDTSIVHESSAEPWTISMVDTGAKTMTGGRLRRVRDYVGDDHFCFTYGDAVASVDITATIAFHKQQGKLATVTAVRPPARFGALDMDGVSVKGFREKPVGDNQWINGGFFVLSPKVIDYIDGDSTTWETEPMERLASEGEMVAYKHDGFWQPMDTLREKILLEDYWATGAAPWVIW